MLNKKGDIATVFAIMIGLFVISLGFYQYILINITTMKHENISQYARDTLLILETSGEIEKDYLLDVKRSVSDKLNMKTGETFDIYIKVGTNPEVNVNNAPAIITADLGEKITVRFTYKYIDKVITLSQKGVATNIQNNIETMETKLSSVSKKRSTSSV